MEDKKYDQLGEFHQGIAIVEKGGKYGAIMVGGKEIIQPIYEALSNFNDGLATAIFNGEEQTINMLGQILVKKEGHEMFLPEEYDWEYDFVESICIVVKNGKYGILDSDFDLIIPCEYEYIEVLSDGIFKFRKGNKWGAIDKSRKLIAEADYINITYETELLLKVESRVQNGSSTELRYGLLDTQGNIVVPVRCNKITRIEKDDYIFLIPQMDGKQGVYDKYGTLIVPFIYNEISVGSNCFHCLYNYRYSDFDISAIYNFYGDHLLNIDDKQVVSIPREYEYAQYAGWGLIKVSKNCKWGIIDILGEIINEPKFDCIDKFDGSFARVGFSLKELNRTYLGNRWNNKDFLYGLIDTSGDVVLPVEYEEIEKWDNDYYVVRKNGLYGLLSPTLHVTIEPRLEYLKKLNDKYILVKKRSEYSTAYMNGLMDYYGNEIIPTYKNISEVEVLENGFLKVIYNRSQYKGFSHIGVLNIKGKEVYHHNNCDDITYVDNGLLLIKSNNIYNIANLQGKVLFNNYYNYIEVLENGNFLIQEVGYYGMARNTGEIFVHPKYTNKIKFENGIAEIKISNNGPSHKVNEKGQVIVSDEDKNEIVIPKDYYWGSDFVHGVSIVRSVKNDKLGVINKQGDVLITPEYDTIDLLSDNTLLVGKTNYGSEYYSYGLYDINGKCIFPAIFKVLEHLDKNRIRVVWNLDKVQSWSPGQYIPGPNKYLDLEDSAEYLVNNRSALCDARGNIISNKNLACVNKFDNGYARSSLTLYVEDDKVYLKQVGIIDINGQTIVPQEYDRIVLYNHYFALLRKEKKYGIADLKNKNTILFNDINIKETEDVDSFGRFIYTDGDCNNLQNNRGVIGPNGIILSPGKYSYIKLLRNGLIQVSNEENTLYGLLDLKGKELLKMEYSYISEFKNGYASICIGGHDEDDELGFQYKHIGGKWGVIDETGKIVVECINDEELVEKLHESIVLDSSKTSECDCPKVICSDSIPTAIYDEVYNYYFGEYDENEPSLDNPYYNDNLYGSAINRVLE